MPITYRKEKNAPLTLEEMDENFRHLAQKIEALESRQSIIPEALAKVQKEGHMMVFLGIEGQVLGEIPLPTYPLNPRGLWNKDASYQRGDTAYSENKIFYCQKDTKTPLSDTNSWVLLFDSLN